MPRHHEQGSNRTIHAHADSFLRIRWYLDTGANAGDPVEKLKQELDRLMQEHLESFRKQAFLPPDNTQLQADEKRLKRIRDVSADYLAALNRSRTDLRREHDRKTKR